MVSDCYLKKLSHSIFKLGVYTSLVSVQNWFAFGPCWPNIGPLAAQKWMKLGENGRYHWCVHLLGESSELIHFWAMLAKCWPSSGRKMTESFGFGPLSEKVPLCGMMITQSFSNMVFTLVRGVFTNYSFFVHKPSLAPLVAISFPFPLVRPQARTCILWCLDFTW